MAPRDSDPKSDYFGPDRGPYVGAIALLLNGQKPHVSLVKGAEAKNSFDPRITSGGSQAIEIRVVTIENGGTALFDSFENFGFGVRDIFDAGKEFHMRGFYRRDQGDMRAGKARQGRDFAGMVHAYLEHRKIDVPRQAGEA